MYNIMPIMTQEEQLRVRKYIALEHEDGGKCRIYGDDGELQCNNMTRHGRCLDFIREPMDDLLDAIEETRLQENLQNFSK